MKQNLKHLKDLSTLKLHLNYKKSGAIELKTISETTIKKIKGYRYDKGRLFKALFLTLGFNVENICYKEFDLFDYKLDEANQFLKNNNINYFVNYLTEVNNNISFIELTKIK